MNYINKGHYILQFNSSTSISYCQTVPCSVEIAPPASSPTYVQSATVVYVNGTGFPIVQAAWIMLLVRLGFY